MIEGKIFGWMLMLALLVAAAGFIIYTHEVDRLNGVLAEVHSTAESLSNIVQTKQKTVAQREGTVAAVSKAAEELEAIDARIAETLGNRDAATKKLETLQAEAEKLSSRFHDTVQAVRKKAVGEQLGDFKTPTGLVLNAARIQNVSDTAVSILHTNGVTRLQIKSAPPEMVSRFRLKAETPPAALSQSAGTSPAASAASPTVAASPPAVLVAQVTPDPPPSMRTEPDPAAEEAASKVREIENRMGDLRVQINAASANKTSWLSQASDYRALHERAQLMGRVSSHLIRANDATNRANACQAQIDAGNAALEKLRQLAEEAKSKLK